MKLKMIYTFLLISISFISWSQDTLNQFDENGKRHGKWKKYFENSKQIRYQGTFNHGKEIGTFYFYCSDCGDQPMVIKEFSKKNDTTFVQFFAKKGKLASQGYMINKKRVGEWLYFQKVGNQIMTKEFYVDGKLEGLKTTYYKNNVVAEEVTYHNDVKEGIAKVYSFTGVLLKKLPYHKDQLNGKVVYYDANGLIEIEGIYKNGLKDGIWSYYKNGKFIKEELFPKPRKKKK
ncbi:MAG: toxin-antitoxin system YwqK family antitoxin [Flavobacteriales bacterium]